MERINFMDYEEIIKKAIEFNTIAHKGQFRKDGKEYITHPIAVMEISKVIGSKRILYYNHDESTRFIISILAIGHDAAGEDVEKYKNNEELYVEDLNKFIGNKLDDYLKTQFITVFKLLNRNYSDNYFEYIMKIKGNYLATIVKLSDLAHNMSDLQEGSLKDKYRLAEYILTH